MQQKFQSFKTFYPFYLSEHGNRTSRILHFTGTTLVLVVLLLTVWSQNLRWLLLAPLVGYGFAWVGHFFFERNRPATFSYPFYSLAGDWVMWKDLITRKIRF